MTDREPWETPFEHLDREEHAEQALLFWIARSVRRIGRRMEERMSELGDQILAAAQATGQAATDAANRVIATLNASIEQSNADKALLAELQAHNAEDDAAIAALQAAIAQGTVPPETAQAVLDVLTTTKSTLDQIDVTPTPVEPPIEPTV